MKIIHRCECGYPEEYHPHVKAWTPWCKIDKAVIRQQPSELIPTFDTAGRVVEDVTEPGTIWPGGHPKITTCACEACWNLYRAMLLEEAS